MNSTAILLIEDDTEVRTYLHQRLQEQDYEVESAANGRDGLRLANAGNCDLMIIDRMLPGIDGLSIVEKLRESGNRTPILFLSALGEVEDRVSGLRAGGDDYLTKPFAFSELLARIEALLRRPTNGLNETHLQVVDLKMDCLARVVTRAEQKIDLQPREFRLLEYLMRHAGQVVSRTMLLENVWDYHFDPQTNVIDVHISRLRRKIDKEFPKPLLHTVRGAGYMLK
ncbi:response regulator transcription factor [Candidatus Venteria ishoeyi]|uniref:Transcriptional regulatory protein CusR n=1 Tax=Candidatus Venteria ishoeyi TaxID=1899563 RepID=A0A1H6F7F1_9GAMM|nr:response regulator transcription factor [Candidatus Venteria ishoeyi]MDM8545957.1 response regulator transcription factor [Candidatus Venteria ishoeyi]SEH06068.1 Transcriptional regulatory protein CusR [Candidatus Venteria ishoeyi]